LVIRPLLNFVRSFAGTPKEEEMEEIETRVWLRKINVSCGIDEKKIKDEMED
jgi:hypothetical protein